MINRFYIYLGSLSAILSAIALIFMRGKKAGKQQSEAKKNERTILTQKAIIKASKPISVDDTVERLRDGDF